jgi:GMP synthase (glutamine-hydrolysing)
LGAQLMAKALGENVFPNAVKEVGWRPIEYTRHAASDPLFKSLPSDLSVLHWHGDTFRVPASATPLALTTACPNQAFRWKQNSYALQFHLEVTPPMLESWCDAPSEQSFIAAAGENPSIIKERTPRAFARLEPFAKKFFSDYLKAAYPVAAAELKNAVV